MTEEKTLVPTEKYLKTGCHIGTKFKSGDMRKFVFKTRKDGLKVMDVETIDERIMVAANFLAQFKPEKIAVVSRKLYGRKPALKFAELIGAKAFTARFIPGIFTNPLAKRFVEPEVLIVTEPDSDSQAIKEAYRIKIPIIALASTNNRLTYVDLAIPINNKGRKSIALVYWLLAREIMKAHGLIKNDAEFQPQLEDFEHQIDESEEREESFERDRRGRGRDDRDRRDSFRPRRFDSFSSD